MSRSLTASADPRLYLYFSHPKVLLQARELILGVAKNAEVIINRLTRSTMSHFSRGTSLAYPPEYRSVAAILVAALMCGSAGLSHA